MTPRVLSHELPGDQSSVNDRLTAALSPNAGHLDLDVDVSGAISQPKMTVHVSRALARASWVSTR
jgi:hypothetical protein